MDVFAGMTSGSDSEEEKGEEEEGQENKNLNLNSNRNRTQPEGTFDPKRVPPCDDLYEAANSGAVGLREKFAVECPPGDGKEGPPPPINDDFDMVVVVMVVMVTVVICARSSLWSRDDVLLHRRVVIGTCHEHGIAGLFLHPDESYGRQ